MRVLEHGQRFPLQNYATVSVSGAEALVVNLFDPAVRNFHFDSVSEGRILTATSIRSLLNL